jgi:KDO2-lipid IV(A) lauroyltransferase
MASKRKEIQRAIKYPVLIFFIHLFIATVRFLPRRWSELNFAFFAHLAFYLVRKERMKTIRTLTLVYEKEKTPKEIRKIACRVFVNQALNFADYLHSIHWKSRERFTKMVDISGEEHLKAAYDKGRGVVCLTLHTGSWELAAIMPPVMGYETSAVSKAMSNPKIDKLIVSARENRGMKNIPRGKSYQKLINVLNRGECLIIMIDQDTQVKGVFVDFFGRKAYTPDGAARIALETQSPVIMAYMKRIGNNRHQYTILPEIPLVNTGNIEHDLFENTRIYTQMIENVIKEIPSQWVWMHERWKTTPEDVERFLANKKMSL